MADVAVAKKQNQTEDLARWPSFRLPLLRAGLSGMSPFALMRRLTDDFDRVFGEELEVGAWSPAVEVKQAKGKLIVNAELPGLKKEEVKVTVSEDGLILEGERKREKEEKGEGYYHSERFYGQFFRRIPLPEGAKVDEAAANFKDGVLEVTVPIPEKKDTTKQIPVT